MSKKEFPTIPTPKQETDKVSVEDRGEVIWFHNLLAKFYKADNTIMVSRGEWDFYFRMAGNDLKLVGKSKATRMRDGSLWTPRDEYGKALKTAYVVLKILKSEQVKKNDEPEAKTDIESAKTEDDPQLDLFDHND